MKRVALLGSTGSIGTQTLDVIAAHPERFAVESLAAGQNIALLAEQVRRFRPQLVAVRTRDGAEQLRNMVGDATSIVWGEEGLIEAAIVDGADYVLNAVVGSQGLQPTLAAIEAGKTIGLANKESLVTGGHLVMEAAQRKGVAIIPVDSEHSAIYQCLNGERLSQVSRLVLTASGGSFRDRTRAELEHVTVREALQHPNWSMGAKITIDSATMVNKGLEVIEAHWLFSMPYEQIDVVLHRESVIHSMVEFVDSAVMAQLGIPDMRIPIQYALTYPERLSAKVTPLNLAAMGKLSFQPMDLQRYPCLRLAYESGRRGGTMPAVFNAANEVAVERFLQGGISFLQIEAVIEQTLERHELDQQPGLAEISEADRWARRTAADLRF